MVIMSYIMDLDLERIERTKKRALYILSLTWGFWFLSLLLINQFNGVLTETISDIIQWSGIVCMFISLWFGFRLFKINRLEVSNPEMANRLNDEREHITRLKSLANGFIATIVIYTVYLCVSIILKVLFGNLSLYTLSGTFTGGIILIMGLFCDGVYLF
jgi:hypothetical protein